ncbi:hypothetical protein COV56_02045 [Candidatus Kuenenbacteria bacterium CG11_big_fil_rev_8_21_14_0_20_37_9]|uniref:O-antigen ligase-related domain-containing protein n=2 Tax=Candidatus Kueneniibacteriota TaxID=1752740 RepID=A0A2M6XSM8_9BACT|nr:MAG: hypothetical protein AUJ29_03245 [Candidatus Kuenenbacteria bacterium CG1_02_38_13]PIR05548.1 MAG: hypothetical protein COV56_02045 [Candidatus Kuenenbacteria bacterium CG11_big_fil_rev_8_21_14_0_20_37_9]PIU10653.1 MAG: hypothetical protein COT27_01845 [Candidatus Kuenenbacteria bacterium CG08_land_8_20_14_0_20_37_23]
MTNCENTTTKYLKYAVWGCLYLVLITPLLVSSKFIFPFITLKVIYFRIVVEIAIFFYLILALANPYFKPKFNKLIWLIFCFGLIVFLTGLLGVNPYKSFWGTIERGEGFLTIAHLIAYFFILAQVVKTKRDWLNFLSAHVITSFLVCIYAIAQRFGASWAIHSGEDRLSSTLGNAAYLGGYMLGNFWFCLLLFFEKKKYLWKIFFALVGIFQVYILFQTQTRGAMLAFILSLFLFSIIGLFFIKNRSVKITSLIIFALLLFAGSFSFMNHAKPWISERGPIHRLLNISTNSITVESRLLAWDSSWQGWQDRFLFGYGWENYNVAFNKYFHPEIYRDAGSQVWFDRAHNTIFDIAVATGIIGLIIYLTIFFCAFVILFKKIRDQQNIFLSLVLCMFLIAHFLQNIFVFDSIPTYIMLFSAFGIIAYIGNDHQNETKTEIKPINLYAIVFGFVALIIAVFSFNINPAQANQAGLDAMKLFYTGNVVAAVNGFDRAIQMATYQTPELRQKLAESIISHYNTGSNLKTDEDEAITHKAIIEIKNNIQEDPLEARNYLYIMSLYNSLYSKDKEKLMQAINYGKKAKTLSPTRQQIYFELGRAALGLGMIQDGLYYFKKAVDLNPSAIDSYWNLLSAYAITGQNDQAEATLAIITKKGAGESKKDLKRLLNIYASIKSFQKMKEIYEKLIVLDPLNIDYRFKLAAVYKALGDVSTARSTALTIKEIKPEAVVEVDKFLETLE